MKLGVCKSKRNDAALQHAVSNGMDFVLFHIVLLCSTMLCHLAEECKAKLGYPTLLLHVLSGTIKPNKVIAAYSR